METQRNGWTVKLKAVQEEKQVPMMMKEGEEDLDEEGRRKTMMMMMMKTLMMRGALMLMMIKILQAELDKRESQWAAAVDNLKLRNCDEQVLLLQLSC